MWISPTAYAKKYNLYRQLVEQRAKTGKLKSRKVFKKVISIEVWDDKL